MNEYIKLRRHIESFARTLILTRETACNDYRRRFWSDGAGKFYFTHRRNNGAEYDTELSRVAWTMVNGIDAIDCRTSNLRFWLQGEAEVVRGGYREISFSVTFATLEIPELQVTFTGSWEQGVSPCEGLTILGVAISA